jgi:sugar phosphate isomerase/epimerase
MFTFIFVGAGQFTIIFRPNLYPIYQSYMSKTEISRRKALQFISVSAGMAAVPKTKTNFIQVSAMKKPAFILCLNMATIRGHNLGFVKELETAAAAGFRSVEIWIDSLQTYLNNGGTISDAKKRLDDLGIKVENLISFTEWIVDDEAKRKNALEELKAQMDIMAQIGCKRVAATGKGATATSIPDLKTIAQRYRTILQLGDTTGVVPQIEMWGFQKNLSKVSEVLYIATESGHPSARILLDIFHFYRGNTSLDTLHLMNPSAVDILHINDYPANFNYETITDADRIYPGDGVAPLKRILTTLARTDEPLVLSTEVFNKFYYQQNALTVAKTSLAKMKAVVESL